jgi:hypothetical protein
MRRSEGERGGSCRFPGQGETGKAGRPGLLKRLWQDDRGAVLATEWVLIATLFLIGLVPALLIIRQGVLSKMLDISGATQQLDESYGFTGVAVGDDRDRDSKTHKADALGAEPGDPVLEEAARVSQREVVRDNNWQDGRRNRARGYAFTAGSLFLEDRHLDGKNGRVPAIPSHSVPAD